MCYEQDEPYVVNDECGEYIAQTPTEESARKHLIEYFNHQDSRFDHIGTGNNATIDLTIAVAEFDLEHPDLYKFHPTAEWSRIQQALEELEELKSYSSDPQCIADTAPIYFAQQEIYVKEVEPLKSERDELAAELERVKAERDEAKEKLIWTTNQLNILQKELWEIHGWDKESCRAANEKGENDE